MPFRKNKHICRQGYSPKGAGVISQQQLHTSVWISHLIKMETLKLFEIFVLRN